MTSTIVSLDTSYKEYEIKKGLYLYETFIMPLEQWVSENKKHRQYANLKINECKYFPNMSFSPENMNIELISAKEIGEDKTILFFKINNEDIIVHNYDSKLKSLSYSYKGCNYVYGNKLEYAMPEGWDKLKGSEDIIGKYDDYDNWLFYSNSFIEDSSLLQIIGWNKEGFSLFFTC